MMLAVAFSYMAFIVPSVQAGDSDSKESTCNAGDLGSIPGLGDPLEKGMATHSSILAWRIPWTEGPRRLESMGLQRVGHIYVTFTFFYCFGVVSFYS